MGISSIGTEAMTALALPTPPQGGRANVLTQPHCMWLVGSVTVVGDMYYAVSGSSYIGSYPCVELATQAVERKYRELGLGGRFTLLWSVPAEGLSEWQMYHILV